MKNEELEGLIHGYLDDRLTGDETAQLNESLRHSTLAREQFWQLAELEGYLTDLADWRRGQEQATDLAMPEALQVFLEMEQEARTTLRAIQPPPEPIKLPGPNLLERAASRGQRLVPYARPLGGALAAAAAVGLVLLLAIDWFGADKPASTGGPTNVTQSAPDVEDEPTPALPVLTATVTNVYGPAAADNTTGPRIGESLRQGDAITLGPGYAELQMVSGTRLILQGPGVFTFDGINAVSMTTGLATANVPPAATGFTLRTPAMDFIDHGTEFGVSLDESGRGEILVFDGLVEAQPPAERQSPDRRRRSMMISEGFGGDLIPGQDLPASLASVESFDSLLYPRNWDHLTYLPRVAGEIDLLDIAPADLSDGAFLTSRPVLIKEKRAVTLDAPLPVHRVWGYRSDAAIPNDSREEAGLDVVAGTSVNSFLIHFDATGSENIRYENDFSVTFPGEVLGVLIGVTELIDSDALFGIDDVAYAKAQTMRASRDAPGHPLHDELRLSDDGRTLTVKMRVSAMDQIRVLVRNTDTDRP